MSRKTRTPESAPPTLAALRVELHGLGSPERAVHSLRFFKTGPGQYGEGDKFLGLTVPEMRTLARKYRNLSDDDALALLDSRWHEDRLVALILLVNAYGRSDPARRKRIHRAYLANTRHINNWDLVDASAGQIVGGHLDHADISLLERLARSKDIWERRIAIVSTFAFIKRDEFRPTLTIATMLLGDSHDLIHKAVGWMLREVGKRDRGVLDRFLEKHYREMPRTTLRYAIERHPESLRKRYLAGKV
ncbi:MAG TPA: DNA alkylation repair protein [Gemmatimonadaceae bacterium]|nr:DNA alkylation repair protein [Gemmatimonadaceae bacterium]